MPGLSRVLLGKSVRMGAAETAAEIKIKKRR
jgi:hypothetical protein